MEYEEFRDYLCKLIKMEYTNDENQGYFRLLRPIGKGGDELFFKEEDLKGMYQNLSLYCHKEATIYNGTSIEILLQDDSPNSVLYDFNFRKSDESWNLEDTQNNVKYEISSISGNFLLCLLKRAVEKIFLEDQGHMYSFLSPHRIVHSLRIRNREVEELQGLPLIEFLLMVFGNKFFTLKINSEETKTFDFFMKLKNGYLFNTMYFTNRALTEYMDIDSAIFPARIKINRTKGQLEDAPLRTYNSDILSYYKKAMSSSDPYIQYISFYHILEYFFDETFHRYLIKDLRDKLTHPDFSYKNDDELLKLAKFAQNRLRQFGENGQGNEFESLKYVLKEFVNVSDLANGIETINITYYSQNKVSFSEGPVITFREADGYSAIAKRIYFTRNSLVHSKSGKKDLTYHPYKHEEILRKEIPLIKKISEMIIINSATLID